MPSPSSRRSTRAKPATAPPEYRQYRQTTRMLLVFARRALAHISPRFSIPAKTCEGIFAAALNDFAESHLEVWTIWRFRVVGGAATFAVFSRKVLIYLSLATKGPAYSDARRLRDHPSDEPPDVGVESSLGALRRGRGFARDSVNSQATLDRHTSQFLL